MQEDNNQLKIGTIPARWMKGDRCWTAFAVNGERQVYCVHIKESNGFLSGEFMIDGEVKFILTGTSFSRMIACTLAASNAYIKENIKNKERRRRRMVAARAGEKFVPLSPEAELAATVARQKGEES